MDFYKQTIAFTHSGKFHADDVFAAALLQICSPDIHIKRVMRAPADPNVLVFDLGGGRFDHHQNDTPVRENGVKYAAFGLLWRELGDTLLGEGAQTFDQQFVEPLDLDDNTGSGHPLAEMISSFNPCWDSDDAPDDAFFQAVAVARMILEKRFAFLQSIRRAHGQVEQALAEMQDGILQLEHYCPWKQAVVGSAALFVLYPSQRGGFAAQGVPQSPVSGAPLKVPFPAEWSGMTDRSLQMISGIETLRFCHASRFLITADSKAGAIHACHEAIRCAANG